MILGVLRVFVVSFRILLYVPRLFGGETGSGQHLSRLLKLIAAPHVVAKLVDLFS